MREQVLFLAEELGVDMRCEAASSLMGVGARSSATERQHEQWC